HRRLGGPATVDQRQADAGGARGAARSREGEVADTHRATREARGADGRGRSERGQLPVDAADVERRPGTAGHEPCGDAERRGAQGDIEQGGAPHRAPPLCAADSSGPPTGGLRPAWGGSTILTTAG